MTIERPAGSGLIIYRRRIDPGLAAEFQAEWSQWISRFGANAENQTESSKDGPIATYFFSVPEVLQWPKSPTARVVGELNLREVGSKRQLFINYQPPQSAQNFHSDSARVLGGVTIVHGGDNGAFDYTVCIGTLKEVEANFRTVEVNAGDVVFQGGNEKFNPHRGRNLGPIPRITGAFVNFL